MATLNKRTQAGRPIVKSDNNRTHEGARAVAMKDPVAALRNVLNAHLLFEDTFYLNGTSATAILDAAVLEAVDYDAQATVSAIVDARTVMNIRTASLRAAVLASKRLSANAKLAATDEDRDSASRMARDVILRTIQRADEPGEVLAQAGGKPGMTHAIRKGVAASFAQFDAYQLMKYRGQTKGISLKDAINLSHPERTPLIEAFMRDALELPNTWESRLSSGEDKRTVFTDLLRENKLGAMALLRNLRGMEAAGVDRALIRSAIARADWSRVLPFRFLSAVKAAPAFAQSLDVAFNKAVSGSIKLPGVTVTMVDVSGSMEAALSSMSSLSMRDAAAALGAAVNGDKAYLGVFGTSAKLIPRFGGLSSAFALHNHGVGHGTNVDAALTVALTKSPDRVIIVTDGQFSPSVTKIGKTKVYVINLAPYAERGVIDGDVVYVTGFSQQVLQWIAEVEK